MDKKYNIHLVKKKLIKAQKSLAVNDLEQTKTLLAESLAAIGDTTHSVSNSDYEELMRMSGFRKEEEDGLVFYTKLIIPPTFKKEK